MDVALTTVTLVAGTPPKLTVAPLEKFDPLIVTVAPPLLDPELGETPFTVRVRPAATANVIESVAPGFSKLSAVFDALRTQTVIR
jgi:hypothetical protein